jgi:tRNA (guanine10-N2)-dimethyltransferase
MALREHTMRRLVFELSGEHETLPKSEVIGCIEAYGWPYRVIDSYDQVLIVETDADVPILAHRLALTHHIMELIFECNSDRQDILRKARSEDLGLKSGETFVVRIKKIREHGGVDASFERELGATIWKRGYNVDLAHPDIVFRAIMTNGVCIFGRLIAGINRGQYEERAPLKKPFFLPGVLMPRISRALVNMARVQNGWLFDPMSGTGGILVEAELMDETIRVVGSDIQKKMVYGTRWNLRHYGNNYYVIRQDSLCLGIKTGSIEAMVTDFPYGQSTPVMGSSVEDFQRGALREIYRVLKPGRYAVIVYRKPMEKLLREAGFKVIESHEHYIHKSLTRHIMLVQK